MPNVDIWSIPLDSTTSPIEKDWLAADEQARAARFYFERDTRRYTMGRASLRLILSHYTGLAPDALQFTYNAYGKPALQAEQNRDAVEFNLSHTGGQALCAVTHGYAVGIDIEEIKPLDYLQLASTVFSEQEQVTLQRLTPDERQLAFFNGWTRKEAYIKAHGKGLSMPLAEFDVTLAPGAPTRLLATRPNPEDAARWSLFGWTIGTTYVAALAIAGQQWQLTHRELNDFHS